MAKVTVNRQVNASPETAFERWLAAYERLHELYPERIKSMKVLEWKGNERVTLCVENWAGRNLSYTMRETLFPPHRVEQRIVKGAGKGSTGVWSFQGNPPGTLVTVEQTIAGVEGFFMGVLFRKLFVRQMNEGLSRYAMFIDSARPDPRGP